MYKYHKYFAQVLNMAVLYFQISLNINVSTKYDSFYFAFLVIISELFLFTFMINSLLTK